jgi:3-oxoacyl-[acyl-carrier protein] reductase
MEDEGRAGQPAGIKLSKKDEGAMKKVALITGGTRGIGLGIAEKFAHEGFNLVLNGRKRPEEVEELISHLRDFGARILYRDGDIADARARTRLLEEARDFFGRLDVLVNNAGVAPDVRADLLDMTEESYERVMRINLQGPLFLTQAAAEWMLEQRSIDPQFRGTVINIGSISAEFVSLNRGEYCISKAGMSMMTKLFAARLGSHDISVFEIRPGIMRTDMTSAAADKYNRLITEGDLCVIKRWGYPADVGDVAVAMASGKMAYCVGQVITVDGGLSLQRL